MQRSHLFKLLGVSITENTIWHTHVSSIATAAGKNLGYLLSTSHHATFYLLTLYKAQIRPSLEYCSHIWRAAAPTTLSILDAVQRRTTGLIGDQALTGHLQPLSHRRAVGDLSLFYRYSNVFCSSELTSIISPLSKPARCTRGTSSHPSTTIHHELSDTTAPLSTGCPEPGKDCLVMYLLSLRVLAYSSFASTNIP
nr:unnamed protein product [Callosobruchus chinensis]